MSDQEQSDIVNDNPATRLLKHLPPHLYKYTGLSGDRIEWMRKLIVDSELYFVPPRDFNDPLDCRIPLRFNASNIKATLHWRRVAREQEPNIGKQERNQIVDKLVRDSKTAEGQKRLTELFFKKLDKTGIISLSKDPMNMLMWSYYAAGHRGIALRFNMSLELLAAISVATIPVEVKYSHAFPDISYYDIQTDQFQFFQTTLGSKSIAWKHEGEWRFVKTDGSGYVHIPPEMIDGVILGMRIDCDSENLVREWISARHVPTKLLRVEHKEDSFDLKVVDA